MRGASALQQVLTERSADRLRVFVVWERVLMTDLVAPSSGTLAELDDPRGAQYWDPSRALSRAILRSVRADPERYGQAGAVADDAIVWDAVALFPPGVRWDEDFPVPDLWGYPVIQHVDRVRDALVAAAPTDG